MLLLAVSIGLAWGGNAVVAARTDLVRVEAARLEAVGGEVDCLVHFQRQVGQETAAASVQDCPAELLPEVEQAAAAWRFHPGAPTTELWSLVMVRGPEVEPELPVVTGLKRRTGAVPAEARAFERTMRRAGAEPWDVDCTVQQTLDTTGAVVSFGLERCPILLRPAVERGAPRWLWVPPTRDGQPVAVVTTFAYRFVSP